MTQIAVDVVLLPAQDMMNYAISVNNGLVKKFGSKIVLNAENCLPHISLAMGCIERDDVVEIGKSLMPLVTIVPKRLKVVGVQKSMNLSGEIISVLLIERSRSLQNLHEKVCDAVEPLFNYDVSEDMLAGGHALRLPRLRSGQVRSGQASPSTLQWIKNYPVSSSHGNFLPHITIGYGELTDRVLPPDFTVSHLALCRLGNHCTCVKILWSVEITQ